MAAAGRAWQKVLRRLLRDYKKAQEEQDNLTGISVHPNPDNMAEWDAVILGPNDTPWEGAVCRLRLSFSLEYPRKPPTVRFTNPMFHPNIYRDGNICLDILQVPLRSTSTAIIANNNLSCCYYCGHKYSHNNNPTTTTTTTTTNADLKSRARNMSRYAPKAALLSFLNFDALSFFCTRKILSVGGGVGGAAPREAKRWCFFFPWAALLPVGILDSISLCNCVKTACFELGFWN